MDAYFNLHSGWTISFLTGLCILVLFCISFTRPLYADVIEYVLKEQTLNRLSTELPTKCHFAHALRLKCLERQNQN